jgi:hypothetical protein
MKRTLPKGGGLALGRSENPRVSGSILFLGTFYLVGYLNKFKSEKENVST